MTHVTSRLTAKNRDQFRNPTLGSRVWATFTFMTGERFDHATPQTVSFSSAPVVSATVVGLVNCHVLQWLLYDNVDSWRTADELTVECRSRKTPRSSANSIYPSRGAKGRPEPLSLSLPAHYSRCPLSERPLDFYPRDAMLARVLAMALCPCLSVTSRSSVETYERIGLVLAWELP